MNIFGIEKASCSANLLVFSTLKVMLFYMDALTWLEFSGITVSHQVFFRQAEN
jgi:hypothetical protein